MQNFRGDISSDNGGWNLDRLEFRAPGFTQVRLSGRLAVGDGTVAFTGPTELDAREPKALAAWLEGRGEVPAGDLRPLNLRGDITLGSERIAIERLKAEFERKTVTGRLVYDFKPGKQPTRLDAQLNAPELDVDAALAFGQALVAGSKIERPQEMTIAADIGQASIGGFTARDASARVKIDGDGLQHRPVVGRRPRRHRVFGERSHHDRYGVAARQHRRRSDGARSEAGAGAAGALRAGDGEDGRAARRHHGAGQSCMRN